MLVPLWSAWTDFLQTSLSFLAAHLGLPQAMAIVLLTLLGRLMLLPLSLAGAMRAQANKDKMARLQPELQRLKEELKDSPRALNSRVLALYRDNGVRFVDGLTVSNLLAQGAFGIGLYQSLQRITFSGKFLWIANLAKPDFWVTALVAALMLATVLAMPGALDNPALLAVMLLATLLISVFAVAALPSSVGLFWATSNAVSLLQTVMLRMWVSRRGGGGGTIAA